MCEIEGRYFADGGTSRTAVHEDCFDGPKTRVDFEDEYLGGYADRYKEMEEEVLRG